MKSIIQPLTPLPLYHGGVLTDYTLAYTDIGPINAPVVVVLGGISASAHAASTEGETGWWHKMVGPHKAINTREFRVIAMDYLGGAYESTGAKALECDVTLSAYDQAHCLNTILHALKITQVHAIIGASFGAMVAQAFAKTAEIEITQLILLASAHKTLPTIAAQRQRQRDAIQLGLLAKQPELGLELARKLGLLSYLNDAELNTRFESTVALESYLQHHAQRFSAHFCPYAYLQLSRAIDLFAINPSDWQTPTAYIHFSHDKLIPLSLAKCFIESCTALVAEHLIPTPHGHDGFLKETDALTPIIQAELKRPICNMV